MDIHLLLSDDGEYARTRCGLSTKDRPWHRAIYITDQAGNSTCRLCQMRVASTQRQQMRYGLLEMDYLQAGQHGGLYPRRP